jgi:hypothetical protein
MGGRIVDPLAIGGQIHAIFGLAPRAGTSGTLLVEISVFPLKKLDFRGLAVHLGAGVVSLTRREPEDPNNLEVIDVTDGRFVTTGGLAVMGATGWDFWLKDRFNFGLHLRFDAGFVHRPVAPSPDPGTRSFIWFPSLELALNWY